jgi:hypothetical protein
MAMSATLVAVVAGWADAQTVVVEGAPVRAGNGTSFQVEVPADWQVDGITVDPAGFGLNTFVRRLLPYRGACPQGSRCFYDVFERIDERTTVGEHIVTFTATGAGRTRTFTTRFRIDAPVDDDHDGMPDTWEWREGLEPPGRLATSAPGDDPDGDGVANIDEFRAGTAPLGRYRQYFGDASPGDRQQMFAALSGLMPIPQFNAPTGHVHIRAIGDDGRQQVFAGRLDGDYAGTIFHWSPWPQPAARILAIEVESERPFVTERALISEATGVLSTSRTVTPSTDWEFATGPTSEPVDAFLLAYNPTAAAVRATFTYYRSGDESPVATERVLQPGRTTVWLNADESALAGRDFAVTVRADAPILLDRGFRWQPPGRTAPQEQVSPGATLASQWFFPYVDAKRRSDEQLVLANPGARECGVEIAVFRREGEPRVHYTTIAAHARVVVRPADFGLDTLAAVRFVTTNGVPFVAEHGQRGSVSQGRWASSTPGVSQTGRGWGLARLEGVIAIWNPSDTDAEVELVSYYPGHYLNTYVNTYRIPARRMHRIRLGQAIGDGEISQDISGHTGIVRSRPKPNGTPGPDIVVGRAAPAGALGVRNVRIEPFIATRLPD